MLDILRLDMCLAVMEIDAVGTFTMSKAAFTALKQAGTSIIINISATLHYGATWYQVHASAAKAAVDSITRSLALEWGEYGIRVNGIAPGPIKGTAGEFQKPTAHTLCCTNTQWQHEYGCDVGGCASLPEDSTTTHMLSSVSYP